MPRSVTATLLSRTAVYFSLLSYRQRMGAEGCGRLEYAGLESYWAFELRGEPDFLRDVRDGIASIRTEKSQCEIEVIIPILPGLQAALDVGPTGDLAFICGERGEPLVKESFCICLARRRERLECGNPLTVSARPARHAQPTGARPWPNWRRFLGGSAARWHRSIRGRQIGRSLRAMRSRSVGLC